VSRRAYTVRTGPWPSDFRLEGLWLRTGHPVHPILIVPRQEPLVEPGQVSMMSGFRREYSVFDICPLPITRARALKTPDGETSSSV